MSDKKIKLEPWGQNILVKRDKVPDEVKNKSGLIVATHKTSSPPAIGTVIAVGPGRKHANGFREPMCIQIGWRVHFPNFNVQEIEHEGEKYIVMDENHVLAIETSGEAA